MRAVLAVLGILLVTSVIAACALQGQDGRENTGADGTVATSAAESDEATATTDAPAATASGEDEAPSTDEPSAGPPAQDEEEPADPAPALQERAEEIVSDLSVEEKAGAVIVAAHTGAQPPIELITERHLGGIVMMDDSRTVDQVRDVNAALSEAAEESGREWPLFLSVDQEGGIVERVRGELTRFPAFMSYGAADDTDLTRRAATASGTELRGLGFTVDLAPDADVTVGPQDPTIGSRSAGSDPELVARHAVAAAEGYLQAGVLPVVKHFPGHGSVPADSHVTLPVQDKSLEELRETDLVPFTAAVNAGLPAVMVAHLQVQALGSTLPSSLDPAVVDGLLRDDLGFTGLVVTDAVNMAGVAGQIGSGRAAVLALEAGADIVLMPADPVAAHEAVLTAVRDGSLDEDRLDEAVSRQIVAMLMTGEARSVDPAAPGEGARVSRQVSAAAITVVSGPCEGALVAGGIGPVGDPTSVRRLTAAAERVGLTVGSGTVVELIGRGGSPAGGADITVATDTPYVLGRSDAPVRIATYGDTPAAMAALRDVLTGTTKAPGRLPVEVDSVERRGC